MSYAQEMNVHTPRLECTYYLRRGHTYSTMMSGAEARRIVKGVCSDVLRSLLLPRVLSKGRAIAFALPARGKARLE